MLRNDDGNTTRYLCRRRTGVKAGYACEEHALHCVICAGTSRLEQHVRICDDCAILKNGEVRCIVCDKVLKVAEPAKASYCHYCVLLERERDGCPKIVGTSSQRKENNLRLAAQQTVKLDM